MTTWIKNAWYVAGWDYEVGPQPLARTILGVPVVLWRKLDSEVVAMRDACPHRMLPLSMGIKEGDSIRCTYHGLKIGPDGIAEEMPLKSDPVNKRICTQTFQIHEQHRFVWIWMGEEKGDPTPFWKGALGKEGQVDRWQICEFIAPSAVMIDVGVAPVEAGATLEKHDQGVRGFVVDFMTPQDEENCHYFWGMARDFRVDDPDFGARFRQQQNGVFDEDIVILEAQQKSLAANPHLSMQSYNIDQGGVRARQMISKIIKSESGQ